MILPSRSYHFVHVGKSAGESIIRTLRPCLPNLTIYHCGKSNAQLAQRLATKDPGDVFILPYRDPVRRYISAFEWDFYEKLSGIPAAPLKNPVWRKIYREFANANDLAEALDGPESERRELAHRAFDSSALHIAMDFGWYIGPDVAGYLSPENTIVLYTRTIEQDVDRFLVAHELPARSEAIPVTKKDYKSQIPPRRRTKALSPRALSNFLEKSTETYRSIRILTEAGVLNG